MAFLPRTQAVSPAPDACYPNFTTAEGCDALNSLTTGSGNTGLGWRALFSNADASFNTAVGGGALTLNNASSNTAVGAAALLLNTTGTENTAIGTDSMAFNDSGSFNMASGGFALYSNTTGGENTAIGDSALYNNTIGSSNTATGVEALFGNTTGGGNTANGVGALSGNNGDNNTAVGFLALQGNTFGIDNIALGAFAGTASFTGSNNIYIGDTGGRIGSAESNVIAIGNLPFFSPYTQFFVGAVYGTTTVSGVTLPVIVSDEGQLGTVPSAARFKKDIKSLDNASESILALRPVKFHYKGDTKGTSQFGLVAEEVAAVNPDLVVRDKSGEIYSVRYDAVNAMLLNEFLKEHKAFAEEQHKVEKLQATVANLLTTVKEQTAQIQKVSRELEMNKAASEVAANGQ